MANDTGVIIVGGGLAGLCCAFHLRSAGVGATVLEASDGVGGRARTDIVDGFRLDRGFQVLLTAYPELPRVIDLNALYLRPFYPGALVRRQGRFVRVVDPWRRPLDAARSIASRLGTLSDAAKIWKLRRDVLSVDLNELMARAPRSTMRRLAEAGFSTDMIEGFFRPFLGGVFLDRDLETSSRMFDFVFRMFATGHTALPAEGMGALATQIVSRLEPSTVRLNTAVTRLCDGGIETADGQRLTARAVVLATDFSTTARLTGCSEDQAWHGTTCLYYAAERSPIPEPILILNGDGAGPVNSVAVLNEVAPTYAPPGKSLISVTVVGVAQPPDVLEPLVRQQLGAWFGDGVARWRPLRSYAIPRALPAYPPERNGSVPRSARIGPGLYACGDHTENPSINGAMASGRRAAEAVLADLRA